MQEITKKIKWRKDWSLLTDTMQQFFLAETVRQLQTSEKQKITISTTSLWSFLHDNIDPQYTNMDCCRVQWCDLLHCGNVILPKPELSEGL